MSRPRTAAPRLLALLAVCALTLTGCLQADYRAQLAQDGSGSIDVEVVLGDEMAAMLSAAGQMGAGSFADMYDPMVEGLPPDIADKVTVEALPEDRGVGVAIRVSFDSPAQLDEIFAALNSDGSGGSSSTAGAPSFRREGDGWRFEMDLEATSTMSTDGPGGLGDTGSGDMGSGDMGSGDFGDLGDPSTWDSGPGDTDTDSTTTDFGDVFAEMTKPRIDLRVEMPGQITEADDTARVDGNVATWSSEDSELGKVYAVSAPGGGTPKLLVLALLGLLGLAVVGGVVVLVLRSRTASSRPPHQGPPPGLPMTAPPSTPTPPPVATDASAQLAGWHPDPTGQAAQRWWDGTRWTEHTA